MIRFTPALGIMTDAVRSDFLGAGPHVEQIMSLVASSDIRQKLYIWQLFSILGKDRITELVRMFYERVFRDKETPWFRDVFLQFGSIEYHVRTQSSMWLDVMGGGRRYVGGEKRLRQHHAKSSSILTSEGAHRWMHHMNETLHSSSLDVTEDPRVIPCIKEFLHYYMKKYAREFDFVYVESPVMSSL
jgi:truncated hemoglobin YjbI